MQIVLANIMGSPRLLQREKNDLGAAHKSKLVLSTV